MSDFVADLIGNSEDIITLEAFLERAKGRHGAMVENIGGKWVVKLPGWEKKT